MLFNIENDAGSKLSGYVVPDGFSTRPTLIVRGNGTVLLTMQTNDPRDTLVAGGRHETGMCGFIIDTDMVEGLADIADLEVVEADSGTLIYRRPHPDYVGQKILRLETHLFPLWRLDHAFRNIFQYSAFNIDQLGRETTAQMFALNHVASAYLSGRLLYRSYAHYAEPDFKTVLILHDPYEEMAERLLVLRNIEKVGTATLGLRDAMGLKGVIEFVADLPIADEKALARALRRMPTEVATALANPLVRQLTTSTPNEMPNSAAVAAALDMLASFEVVGLRREPQSFVAALAELLGVDPGSIPSIATIPSVVAMADMLRRTGAIDGLIDRDLELYHYVSAAFKKVA